MAPQLPIYDDGRSRPTSRTPLRLLIGVSALLALCLTISAVAPDVDLISALSIFPLSSSSLSPPTCPTQPKLLIPANRNFSLPDGYRKEAADRLSAAVRIATISYDDNGLPLEDERWKPFFQFQHWLQETFPVVFNRPEVTLEKINELGILTTVQGSDRSLKPLLLLSHYDVTPAPLETYDRWTHPPFSGYNDGEFIWGRGSSDDKTLLVAQYEALALLLADPTYNPRRTIILSHGFDEEEVFARQGAGELAKLLEKRYGNDSMLLVIDEGTSFAPDAFGEEFAVPSSSEKGYLDVKITVGTPGGHSSVPPPHSGIGIMADLIHALEANPYAPSLDAGDPVTGFLACAAEHSPEFPSRWRKLLAKGGKSWTKLADEFGKGLGPAAKALVTTTQALDVIRGGVKVNSLPEEVTLLLNHRIAFSSSINATQQHIISTLSPIADRFNISLSAFARERGEDDAKLGGRYVKVETFGLPLEPAPRSPTEGGVWELFAGSIKGAFPEKASKGKDLVVSPYSSTGNTDTKVYHSLSRSVFRFVGNPSNLGGNAHTVDEHTAIDGHLGIVRWIWSIVLNADEYDGEQ